MTPNKTDVLTFDVSCPYCESKGRQYFEFTDNLMDLEAKCPKCGKWFMALIKYKILTRKLDYFEE